MRRLERSELRPGLAMFLEPELMLASNATFSGGQAGRARRGHYFLYLGTSDAGTDWLATSSKPAQGRVEIRAKSGPRGAWRSNQTYADMWQVWTVQFEVVQRVALQCDRSIRGQRNYADLECLKASDDLDLAA
jgi:hypothetical protein